MHMYFKRFSLRAFSEQFPLILKWVEILGFDMLVKSDHSHYALRKFWAEHCYTCIIMPV